MRTPLERADHADCYVWRMPGNQDPRSRVTLLHPVLFCLAAFFGGRTLASAGGWEWAAAGLVVLGALAVAALSLLYFRDAPKAALFASVVVIPVVNDADLLALYRAGVPVAVASSREILFLMFAALWVACFVAVRQASVRRVRSANTLLLAASAGMLATTLIVGATRSAPPVNPALAAVSPLVDSVACPPADSVRPDVYFVIFDSRIGEAALKSVWGESDSAMNAFLRERGFYVADSATSNYGWTGMSLAATLDMQYVRPGHGSPRRESAVPAIFASCGYRLINFGYFPLRDVPPAIYANSRIEAINFLQGTSVGAVAIKLLGFRDNHWGLKHVLANVNGRVIHELAGLQPPAAPMFVYAHLMVPHEPFIYGRSGGKLPRSMRQPADPELYKAAFLEQLRYSDSLLRRVVSVAERGDRPAVVILQGDHGLKEAGVNFSILHAIKIPGGKQPSSYPSVSSVNTFRIVFNSIFGSRLAMLPDTSSTALW